MALSGLSTRARWSTLVILGPPLVYLVIMMLGGLVGVVELSLLVAVWLVGLTAVWWPRHQ